MNKLNQSGSCIDFDENLLYHANPNDVCMQKPENSGQYPNMSRTYQNHYTPSGASYEERSMTHWTGASHLPQHQNLQTSIDTQQHPTAPYQYNREAYMYHDKPITDNNTLLPAIKEEILTDNNTIQHNNGNSAAQNWQHYHEGNSQRVTQDPINLTSTHSGLNLRRSFQVSEKLYNQNKSNVIKGIDESTSIDLTEMGEVNLKIRETKNCFMENEIWQIARTGVMAITVEINKMPYPVKTLFIRTQLIREKNQQFGINFVCKKHNKEAQIIDDQYVLHPRHVDIKNSSFLINNQKKSISFKIKPSDSSFSGSQEFGLKMLCNNDCETNDDDLFTVTPSTTKQVLVITVESKKLKTTLVKRILRLNVQDKPKPSTCTAVENQLTKSKVPKTHTITRSFDTQKKNCQAKEEILNQLLNTIEGTCYTMDYPRYLLKEKLLERADAI